MLCKTKGKCKDVIDGFIKFKQQYYYRCSCSQVLCKKGVLKIFRKFTEKHRW